MKAEDLRIGNTVDRGVIYEIRNTVARVKYGDRYSLIAYEDLKPIPLTEEILIERGFEKIGLNYRLLTIGVDYFEFCIYQGFKFELSEGMLTIDYLHDLENLYYALTKTKL